MHGQRDGGVERRAKAQKVFTRPPRGIGILRLIDSAKSQQCVLVAMDVDDGLDFGVSMEL